jgi:hypothetical protein
MGALAFLARVGSLKLVAAVFGATVLISGCAQVGAHNENLTPEQRELRERTQRFNETVITGAAAGAVLGGVLGALVSRDRAQGAVIGAAAGAALGGGAGYYIATRNERFATREEAANARITAARREANDLARTASVAERVTRENRARIGELDRRYRAGQITAAQYRQETASMREDLSNMRNAARKAGEVSVAMAGDAGSSDAALRAQANRAAEAQRTLERSAAQLEEALRRVPAA